VHATAPCPARAATQARSTMSDIRLVIFDWVIGQMQFKGMVKPLYAVQSSSINDGQNFVKCDYTVCVYGSGGGRTISVHTW